MILSRHSSSFLNSTIDLSAINQTTYPIPDGIDSNSILSIDVPYNQESSCFQSDELFSSVSELLLHDRNESIDSNDCVPDLLCSNQMPTASSDLISQQCQVKRRFSECGELSRSRMSDISKIGMKRHRHDSHKPIRFDALFGEVYACSSDSECTFIFSKKHVEFIRSL